VVTVECRVRYALLCCYLRCLLFIVAFVVVVVVDLVLRYIVGYRLIVEFVVVIVSVVIVYLLQYCGIVVVDIYFVVDILLLCGSIGDHVVRCCVIFVIITIG
jgi:hypothetical protein